MAFTFKKQPQPPKDDDVNVNQETVNDGVNAEPVDVPLDNDLDDDEVLPVQQPKKPSMMPLFIIAGVFLVIIIGIILVAVMRKSPSEIETSAQTIEAPQEVVSPDNPEVQQQAQQLENQALSPIYPPEHFVNQDSPIQYLVQQATESALLKSDEYMALSDGTNIKLNNGAIVPINDPSVQNAIDTTYRETMNAIEQQNLLSMRPIAGSDNNATELAVRDGNGGWLLARVGDEQTRQAIESVQNQVYSMALTTFRAELSKINPPANASNTAQVDTGLTEEQKGRYQSLIDTQKQEIEDLRQAKRELKEAMAKQEQSITNILQSIEDTPATRNRLQASSMAQVAGYEVMAISGNRVWLKKDDGTLINLAIGDTLPNSNLVIMRADSQNGDIFVVEQPK